MADGNTVLIIGASRGLGLALAGEYLRRGWDVTGTVRGTRPTELHALADRSGGHLTVESLDINEPAQVAALRERLASTPGAAFDVLFVNAGITNDDVPVSEVPTETFIDVMVTNVLSPMRVVAALHELVPPKGTIAVMSSRQGSVSLNERGGHEVYRASKSALNQLMRSYAARHRDDTRTFLLVHPGHVQTGLGGPGAPFTAGDTIPGIVDMIGNHTGEGGLQFRSWEDETVPW